MINRNTDTLSKASAITTQVARCNEALAALVALCFERVEKIPVNVCTRSRRILVALPWGSAGGSDWGRNTTERDVLRAIMIERSLQPGALFAYDQDTKTWSLNTDSCKSEAMALAYLQANPITVREWIVTLRTYNAGRVEAVQASRQRTINGQSIHRQPVFNP